MDRKAQGPRLLHGTLFRNPAAAALASGLDPLGRAFLAPFQEKSLPQRPHKILLAKLDHLGDMVLFLHVLPALRKAAMGAELHLLCGSWSLPLVEGHPMLAKIFTLDHALLNRRGSLPSRFARMMSDLGSLLPALRRERYDIVLDFRAYFPNIAPFVRLIGSKASAGFGTAGLGFLYDLTVPWREDVHETEHLLDLARLVAPSIRAEAPDLSYLLAHGSTGTIFPGLHLGKKRLTILQPGAGNRSKLWAVSEWKKLIAWLEERGFQTAAVGSEGERNFIQTIVHESSAANLAGLLTIPQTASLLKKAEWLIGTDSFAAHLAASLGTRTVVVSSGIEKPEQWRPLGKHVHVLTKHVECSPCFLNDGCGTMDCLGVTAEDVEKIIG